MKPQAFVKRHTSNLASSSFVINIIGLNDGILFVADSKSGAIYDVEHRRWRNGKFTRLYPIQKFITNKPVRFNILNNGRLNAYTDDVRFISDWDSTGSTHIRVVSELLDSKYVTKE